MKSYIGLYFLLFSANKFGKVVPS